MPRIGYCILCGRDLPPPPTGWRRVWDWFVNPIPFPQCEPSEECFRGLARRMGFEPTDEEVREQVRRARRK